MKNKKYEFIQRIAKEYVGKDCVQVMIPYLKNGITILNSDGMTYHCYSNSNVFINKYINDERRKQFPYSQIPTHVSRVKAKKVQFINQFLDYNKVYITFSDNSVKEYYVIKDGNEALLAEKFIIPNNGIRSAMSREKIEELINHAMGVSYSLDGSIAPDFSLSSNEEIVNWYKQLLLNRRKWESSNTYTDREIDNYLYNSIEKITIADIPQDIIVFKNALFVSINDEEIESIKSLTVKTYEPDNFMIEINDFPITFYSLEQMKQLEQTNSKNTPEPKFPRTLNSNIDFNMIKEEKNQLRLVRAQK